MKGCDIGVLVGLIDRGSLPDEAEEIPDRLTRFEATLSNEEGRTILYCLSFSKAQSTFRECSLRTHPLRTEQPPAALDMPFVIQMIEHLRSVFPFRWGVGEEIERFILEGIRKAAKYGIYLEEDVGLYLELASVYGADFDTNPETAWAGEILHDPHLNGSEKMDRLDSYEIFELPFEQK